MYLAALETVDRRLHASKSAIGPLARRQYAEELNGGASLTWGEGWIVTWAKGKRGDCVYCLASVVQQSEYGSDGLGKLRKAIVFRM